METERFFENHREVMDLYQSLEQALIERHPDITARVSRSQIAFWNDRPFAWAWLPIRSGIKGRPEHYLIVSFGLDREIRHPRLIDTAEPYPGRWTHHTIVVSREEVDEELMGWLEETYCWKKKKWSWAGQGESK